MDILTNIVFFMIFMIGIILALLHGYIEKNAKNCLNRVGMNANKGILIIAVIFLLLPLAYYVCHTQCNCKMAKSFDLIYYMIFFFIIGTVLVSLGITIQANIVGDVKSVEQCRKVNNFAMAIWGLGAFVLFLSGSYLSVIIYKNYGKQMGDYIKYYGPTEREKRFKTKGAGQLGEVADRQKPKSLARTKTHMKDGRVGGIEGNVPAKQVGFNMPQTKHTAFNAPQASRYKPRQFGFA